MVVKIKKHFCLTFDLEEFDMPKGLTEEERYEVSAEGLKKIIKLLREEGVKATFFTTAKFISKYPKLVSEISNEHEIASHGYTHDHEYGKMDETKSYELIKKSKEEIETITKKEISGFRAPRMSTVNPYILKKIGFMYDSSSLPALIPGRLKDFFKPRKMHTKAGIKIVPSSVTPILKIPLMWYGFRNYGLMYAKIVTKFAAMNNSYVSTYFHPWEFMDVTKYDMAWGRKRNSGEKLERLLKEYIRWCKKSYEFVTISEMIKKDYEMLL